MRNPPFALVLLGAILLFLGCDAQEPAAPTTDVEALLFDESDNNWHDDDEGLGFHFLSMADAGVDNEGVNHRILMTGTGRFNRRNVVGGGFFNHFDVGSAVPQTLLATGTWRAKRVISFTKIDHPENPWGFNLAGILEMEVRLFPVGGSRHGIPATLTIVCNIPPAGIFAGRPEGYFLVIDELEFEPATFPGVGFPFGITSFSVNPGQR